MTNPCRMPGCYEKTEGEFCLECEAKIQRRERELFLTRIVHGTRRADRVTN